VERLSTYFSRAPELDCRFRPIIHSTNDLLLVFDKNLTNDLCNSFIISRVYNIPCIITPPPIGSAEYCDERVCVCACVNIESAGSRSLPQEQRVPRRRVVRLAGVSRRHFRYTSIRCAVVSQAFSVFVQLVAQVYLQQTDVTEFEPMTKNLRKSAKFRIRHKAGLSYASETQQLSYVRWLTPHPLWSCCGAVDSQ